MDALRRLLRSRLRRSTAPEPTPSASNNSAADTSMSDQAEVSAQSASGASEHEPMEVDYDPNEQSDEDSDDSDVDQDDNELASQSLSAPLAPAPPHPTSSADPLADRRPRIIDVPDDDDRARRTPISRTATPTPSLVASGSARPIRPLPRAFTSTGHSMPMAGSYVRQGLSASTSSTRAQHAPPTPHQVPTQPSLPDAQPNPQQPQQQQQQPPRQPGLGQGLPPAWFSTMLQNALSQGGRGGAVFVIGPDGVPRMAGGSPRTPPQQQSAPDTPPTDPTPAQQETQGQPESDPLPPFDLFSMFDARPKDDPGQARRLIEGLEEIPIGLVKRHVRVEQAGGEGNGACAVCFECLDDSEDTSADWKAAADAAAPSTPPQADADSSAVDNAAEQQEEEPLRPRALVLPCGHAFHSTCLEPWFQQHTTCPNCRFDLDPQRLTSTAYVEGRSSSFPFLSSLFGGGQQTPGAAGGTSMPLPPQLAQSLLSSLFGGLAGATANANAPQPGQQQPQQQQQQQPQPAQSNTPPPPAAPSQPQPNANGSTPGQSFADMLARLGVPMPSSGSIPPVFGPAPPQQRQQEQQQSPPQPVPITPPNANGPAPSTGSSFADILSRLSARLPPRTEVPPVFGPAPPTAAQPAAGPGAGTGARPGSIEDLFSIRFDIGLSFTPVPSAAQAGQPGPAQPQPQQAQEQPEEEEVHTSTISFDFLFGGPGRPGAAPAPGAQDLPNLGPGFGSRFGGAGSPASSPSSQARRKWSRPDTKGRTLRQRVEDGERALGLRCDSMSCDVAPTDDDPTPSMPVGASLSTVRLHQHSEHGGKHCEHAFHPQCIVTHARVTNSNCESVACPVCRVEGAVEPKDWEEGERAIQTWLEQP